jgi:lipoate-protein ligase B
VSALAAAWLGRVPFRAAAALQETLRRRILDGDAAAETLLLVEHDPVITLGRSARAEHILAAPSELAARGITVERATRGGDVTWHGPGQLVVYPVMRLVRGVLAHVEALAAAAVEVAAARGVAARFRRDCPGVWVGDRKLASIGVHVHRRVAVHGLALNVATAPDAFNLIIACGLPETRAIALADAAGRAFTVEELVEPFAAAFARAAGRAVQFVPAPPIPPLQSRSAPVESKLDG